MLQVQVIGNLGADAEVKEFNGSKGVCFNVAHTERWTDEQGTKHENTTWVSCILNGDGGKLLPYLVLRFSLRAQGLRDAIPRPPKNVSWQALIFRYVTLN